MKKLLRFFTYCLLLLIAWIPAIGQTADFTFSPDGGCAPGIVAFTDASGPGVTSRLWNFGGSNTSIQENPSWTFPNAGVYPVTLTITNASGTSTKTQNVTVYGKPTAAFTATRTADCAPFTTSFTATATLNGPAPGTYLWDFGDGNTGSGATVSHTYALAGTYNVTVRVLNAANCDISVQRTNYITAHPKPFASFVASQTTFCTPTGTPTFTNMSSGGRSPYTSLWNYGDNSAPSASSTHTYNTNGYFTVTLITTDANGCKDTSTSPNFIGIVGQSASFTMPTQACENQEVVFTNTTTGAVSATYWDFGDGTPLGEGTIATHVYANAGTYTVKDSTIVAGCSKVAPTRTIVVHPNPTVTITQSPSIPCPPPVPITFTAVPTRPGFTVSSYVWTTPQGTKTPGATLIDTFTRVHPEWARAVVKLQLISSDGCRDSVLTDTVAVRSLFVSVTPGSICSDPTDTVKGCDPLETTFGVELYQDPPQMAPPCVYMPYPVGIATYLYKFSDGSPNSTSPNPRHTFTPSGDYRVDCRITTTNGCIDSSWRMVHVDTPVKPDFYAVPLDICPKEPIVIHNTTANHLPFTRYTFIVDPSDTTFSKGDLLPSTIRIKRFGVYTVNMYSNHLGCIDSLIKRRYIRVRPPAAEFYDSIFCYPNLGAKFFNISDSATSYKWFFGDGITDTATNPSHTYATIGEYQVTLVAYNNIYNCTDTFRKKISIFKPDISFVADRVEVCRDGFVSFFGAFGGTGEIRYSWLLDNYRTGWDTARMYTHQYTQNGYHNITLYAISGNNCLDSFKRQNYVLTTRPTVMFTATPHVGCEPLELVYTDNSTNVPGIPAVSKIWVFGTGDSSRSLASTLPYRYDNRGIYNPQLIVTDSLGCSDSLTQNGYVQVYHPTAIFLASDDSVCTNEPIFFRSYGTGKNPLRHDWTFGNNTSGTGDTITYRYPKAGLYHVELIVTDSVGCKDTIGISQDIMVDAPTAAFSMSDSLAICPPLEIRFTNQSVDAVSYSWNFGTGGGPVVVRNPVSTFVNPGLYNVYLVATNINGCRDTARSQVRVLGYSGALNYTPLLGCTPMQVNFSTPISGIPVLTWDFGDGSTTTTTNSAGTTHTYQTPGAYLPKVLFSDGDRCTALSLGIDTIRVDRLTPDFTWTTPCEGVPFTLSSTSTGIYSAPDSFRWTFAGSAATRSGPSPQYMYASAGPQAITLTVQNPAGCTATITKNVVINPSPDLNAMADTAICPGDTAMLRAGNAVTYTWTPSTANPGAWLSCTSCQFPLAAPGGVPARYVVTATDANGCIGHDSTQIVIQIKTTSSIGDGGEICLGESFQLNAAGAQKYEWMPAATIDNPFIANPVATPRQTTTYIVAAQEGTCLIDSQRVTVIVRAAPDFSAGQDKIIALGSAATLEPKGNFTRINWLFSDTTLSCWNCRNPNAHPQYTRTYVAEAENEWGCKTRDSVTVFVRCNGSLVFIPNTFTPNGDGENDYFFPQGAGFDHMLTFRVFNRWGEMLFEARNVPLNAPRSGWDGFYKGQPMIPDTYVYSMSGLCPTGEVMEFKGDITIIQ